MNKLVRLTAAAVAASGLTACVASADTRPEPAMREAGSTAESACMVAVNNNYGGKVGDIVVTSSEFSQANSLVMMKAGGETWKCLVSNDGVVQDLSVVGR